MSAITAVSITATTPAGTVLQLNTTDAAAARAGTPSAVQGVSVEWSQDSLWDHQSAGRLIVTIFAADPRLIPWESLVEVSAQVDDRPAIKIGRGWVAGLTWSTYRAVRPDGSIVAGYLITLDCAGVLERAAATKLAAIAGVQESTGDRVAKINAAAGWAVSGALAAGYTLAPLAIAAGTSARDALASIAATAGAFWPGSMVERSTGIAFASVIADYLVMPTSAATAAFISKQITRPVTIPSGVIKQAGRALDRAGAVNKATIQAPATLTSTTRADTVVTAIGASPFSTAEVTVTVDNDSAANMVTRVKAVLSELTAYPAAELQETGILIDRLPAADVERILGMDTRGLLPVVVTSCPTDVDECQHLAGGKLTIIAGDPMTATLSATLRSSRLANVRPVRFADLPTAPVASPVAVATTFALMGTVAASDLVWCRASANYKYA